MNPQLRAFQRRRAGPQRLPARVGMNMAQLSGRAGFYANLLYGFREFLALNNYQAAAPVDSSGFPTTDFMLLANNGPYSGPPRDPQYISFGGWCDTVTSDSSSYTLSNKTYDISANVTTIAYTDQGNSGPYNQNGLTIKFSGTRRTGGSTGAVNTGLTNLVLTTPGVTLADIAAGKVWTNEAIAFAARYSPLRFMDSQPVQGQGEPGVNNDYATQWAGPSRSFYQSSSFVELIGLANAAGVDPWFCVGVNWTDQSVRDLAALLDQKLAPGLRAYLENHNEVWNFGLRGAAATMRLTCAEVKGAVGGAPSYGFRVGRVSGVVTLTFTDPHGLQAGGSLYVNNLLGINGSVTLASVPSATTATFSAAGSDASAGTDPGSGSWVVGNLSTVLSSPDGQTNIYELRRRHSARRSMQISELFRSVVGDAKMGTRFRMVYADQMGNDPNAYDTPLQWLSTAFPARAVGQDLAGSNGAYLWGFAGAPYFFSTQNQAGLTADQVSADLLSASSAAQNDYHFANWIAVAKARGLKPIWYEGGPDTSMTGNQLNGSTNLQGADAQARVAAQYTAAAGTALTVPMRAFIRGGGYAVMVYHNACGSPTEDYTGQYAWSHFARSLTDLTSGKPAAIAALQASGVTVTA